MKTESRDIPLDDIRETHLLLRLVERESLEYMELRDSIAANGPLNSICVRPVSPGKFEVVDGMYRYTIFHELGISPVPCLVREMTDEEVVAAQIQANAIRPTMKRTDFARRLKQILNSHPGMSISRLQNMVHKSPGWINTQLGLLNLQSPIQKAVDRGEIPLASAYTLSRVTYGQQLRFVDLAKTASVKVFKEEIAAFIKQQREAARQGKLDVMFASEHVPVAHLRNLREALSERNQPVAGPLLLAAAKARTAVDGWNACLTWMIHLDAKSVEEQRAKHVQRMQKHFS